MRSPVAGLMLSNRRPAMVSVNAPLIKAFVRKGNSIFSFPISVLSKLAIFPLSSPIISQHRRYQISCNYRINSCNSKFHVRVDYFRFLFYCEWFLLSLKGYGDSIPPSLRFGPHLLWSDAMEYVVTGRDPFFFFSEHWSGKHRGPCPFPFYAAKHLQKKELSGEIWGQSGLANEIRLFGNVTRTVPILWALRSAFSGK